MPRSSYKCWIRCENTQTLNGLPIVGLMHRLPNPFSEPTLLCSDKYMVPAGRLQTDSLPPALASQQSPNGEPHSGHVLNTMWSFEHPKMPDEHTKHLNQVVQSHSLCHIGCVESEEVYSNRPNSPPGSSSHPSLIDLCSKTLITVQSKCRSSNIQWQVCSRRSKEGGRVSRGSHNPSPSSRHNSVATLGNFRKRVGVSFRT
jgi:hypothetical protein